MRPTRSFWRTPVDQEVESEIAFHLEMATRDLVAQGMSSRDARAEAQRRFGDTSSVNAECRRYGNERERNARRAEYHQELTQDLAFGVRQLVQSRGFTAVAVFTLALGIGATAAVFSVLDAVVLRPLPFPHADRIVNVWPMRQGTISSPSAPEFLGQAGVPGFEYAAASISGAGATMTFGDRPETISSGRVSADFFKVFGVQPELGRTFSREEDQPGQAGVVVLSHHMWMTRFGGDRGITGRTVTIDAIPRTVIGVMPASFELTTGGDELWLPLALTPEQATRYGEHFLTVTARLGPHATRQQAAAASTAAERRVVEHIPDRTSSLDAFRIELTPYKQDLIGDYSARLFILLGAVAVVLLIACVNVANLLLARGTTRMRELAIRSALGAGRARLVRQLLTESLVLSIAGAAAGLAVAFGLVRVIVSVAPPDLPRLGQVAIDGRVVFFTLVVSVVCSVVFGLMPALRTAGTQLQGALRQGGRGGMSARDRTRAVLVAAEVALAITLVVGAGLLIRSAILAARVDPGFDPHGVLAARLVLPGTRYPSADQGKLVYEQIRDAAARIPGVRSAALVSVVPLSSSQMNVSVRDQRAAKSDHSPSADFRAVSSAYFATMGIPLLAGRDISDHDTRDAPEVAVINMALAKLLWPALQPSQTLGKRITTISRDPDGYATVVGVVGNVHEAALTTAAQPELFTAAKQIPDGFWAIMQRSLVVVVKAARSGTSAEMLVQPLAKAVASVDPSLPLADHHTMESYLRDSLRTARMNTMLLSLLGGIALLLAMVGIYGVVSYFVSQRTNEIGLRMALGATPSNVWRFVVQRGLRPIVAGLVVGMGLALATTTVLEEQLYGVTARDPATLVAVGGLLLAIALVAMYLPARRAMRVSPIVALNET